MCAWDDVVHVVYVWGVWCSVCDVILCVCAHGVVYSCQSFENISVSTDLVNRRLNLVTDYLAHVMPFSMSFRMFWLFLYRCH